jgi:hypothetical protein
MIKTETVFVLGAGASVPFGFPTGAELRRRLCSELKQGLPMHELLARCGIESSAILAFREEFERSGVASIDTFIAYRPLYQQIGELAIAAALMPLEDQSQLFNVGNKRGDGGWYQLLWNELLSGVKDPSDLKQNRVAFITFNYDRSLEQYLLSSIQNTFGVATEEAFDLLSDFRFRHVYGSLGQYEHGSGYGYGGHDKQGLVAALRTAQTSIRTVPAVRGPRDVDAAAWLAAAQRVFVMGFGFDATNCDRIGIHGACTFAPKQVTPRHVFASAFHLTRAELQWCESNSCAVGQGGLIWTEGDCLTLLRDRRDYLS